MAKPFQGTIKLDIPDSVPDRDAFLPDKAPEDAPNVLVVLYDEAGARRGRPYDVADDAYVEDERHMAAAMARD